MWGLNKFEGIDLKRNATYFLVTYKKKFKIFFEYILNMKLSIKYQVVPYIINDINLKSCWYILKSLYAIKHNEKKLMIHNKFSHLCMEEGTSMGVYL